MSELCAINYCLYDRAQCPLGQGDCARVTVSPQAYKARWESAELTMEMYEDKWDTMPPMDLEETKAALRRRFPAYQIWYVPNPHGGPTWIARPALSLEADSAAGLARKIEADMALCGPESKSESP